MSSDADTTAIFERPEIEKLRYAMLELTRRALADDPHLRAYVLMLGGTLGFADLVDAEAEDRDLPRTPPS